MSTFCVELLGTLPGSGSGPVGGANIQDSPGSLAVNTMSMESNLTPDEVYALLVNFQEADEPNPTPTETNDFQTYLDGGNEQNNTPDDAQSVVIMQQPDFANNVTPDDSNFRIDAAFQEDDEPIQAQAETSTQDITYTDPGESIVAQVDTAFFDLAQTDNETTTTPTETAFFDLTQTDNETSPTPSETAFFDIALYPGDEPSATPVSVETFALAYTDPGETVAAQTDAATQAITYTDPGETNSAMDDSNFSTSIQNSDESSPAPTSARGMAVSAGATTATQTTSAGSGWLTPANAQGLPDATGSTNTANLSSGSGVSPTNQAGTLILSWASMGSMALDSPPSSIQLTLTFYKQAGTAVTVNNCSFEYSMDGGSTYTTVNANFMSSATNSKVQSLAPVTVPMSPNNLSQLRCRFVGSCTGSVAGTSVCGIDAVVASWSTSANDV